MSIAQLIRIAHRIGNGERIDQLTVAALVESYIIDKIRLMKAEKEQR